MAKTFVAKMELYQDDENGQMIAHILMQGQGEEHIVEVPPHMAAMLPQAMAMMQAEAVNSGQVIDG